MIIHAPTGLLYCSVDCYVQERHKDDADVSGPGEDERFHGSRCAWCDEPLPETEGCGCALCRELYSHPADCPGDCGAGGEHGADPRKR